MDTSMYMIVGFEVAACSIERVPGAPPKDVSCGEFAGDSPPKPQEIKKGAHAPAQLGQGRATGMPGPGCSGAAVHAVHGLTCMPSICSRPMCKEKQLSQA